MIKMRALCAIPGVCLEACDEITVPNAVGNKCINDGRAHIISINWDPPADEWKPIPIPPPPPPKYEPSDPLEYPAGRRVAKIAQDLADAKAAKAKKAAADKVLAAEKPPKRKAPP